MIRKSLVFIQNHRFRSYKSPSNMCPYPKRTNNSARSTNNSNEKQNKTWRTAKRHANGGRATRLVLVIRFFTILNLRYKLFKNQALIQTCWFLNLAYQTMILCPPMLEYCTISAISRNLLETFVKLVIKLYLVQKHHSILQVFQKSIESARSVIYQ